MTQPLTPAAPAPCISTITTMARGVGLQPASVTITVPRHASAAASDELVAEVKKLAAEEGKHFVNDFGGAPQTARSRAMVSVFILMPAGAEPYVRSLLVSGVRVEQLVDFCTCWERSSVGRRHPTVRTTSS